MQYTHTWVADNSQHPSEQRVHHLSLYLGIHAGYISDLGSMLLSLVFISDLGWSLRLMKGARTAGRSSSSCWGWGTEL